MLDQARTESIAKYRIEAMQNELTELRRTLDDRNDFEIVVIKLEDLEHQLKSLRKHLYALGRA